MYFMSLYINGTEWTGRTEVLTGTATDTFRLVDGGDQYRHFIIRIQWDHFNGSSRTMALTIATLHSFGNRDTVLFDPYSMTYLSADFFFLGNRLDGTCRTNL